ncbi:MAG TPA: hypothetical protein VNO31_36555, partial [Umezawaea sp.]|nr:hypothetical protein [Umezawaea sp.]
MPRTTWRMPMVGLSASAAAKAAVVTYRAPEQAVARSVDAPALGAGDVDTRADVYALGAILYELL